MPRSYRHIKEYEKEIESLRNEGDTSREIGNKLGFSYKQMRKSFYRSNVTQREVQAGISLKRKDRTLKDYVVSEQDKVTVTFQLIETAKWANTRKNGKWVDDIIYHTIKCPKCGQKFGYVANAHRGGGSFEKRR